MTKPYDNAFSRLIDDHLDDWAAYLAGRLGLPPGPATAVETDVSSNLQADRLIRVAGPEPALIHVELESSSRLGIPNRLLSYNVAAWRTSGEPVRSVLMLLRPSAKVSDQTGRLTLSHGGVPYLTFDYAVIRLWQESPDALLAGGPGLAPLALLTNAAQADTDGVFAKFLVRLQRPDIPSIMRDDLLNSTFVLSGLRHHPDRMALLYKDFIMTLEDSSTYLWIRDKGVVLGEIAALRRSILKLAASRFGQPTAADASTLAGITDAAKLDKVFDSALVATDWSDLLRLVDS